MADYVERQTLIIEADPTEVNQATAALTDQYSAFTKVTSAAKKQAEALDQGATAQKRVADAALKVQAGSRQAAQGILDISRAAQDFAQGGLPAIVNNLEGIGRGIPALLEKPAAILTSLPALATLAGVGLLVLGPPLLKLAKDFGIFGTAADTATGAVGKLSERIKELEGQKVLIPVEVLELANARKEVEAIKSALQAVENLRKTQAGAEGESGKAVTSAIAESTDDQGKHLGAEAFTAKLRADLVKEMQAREDERAKNEQGPIREQLEALEKLNEGGRDPGGEAMRVKIRDDLAAAVKRATEARTAITTGSPDGKTPAGVDRELGTILENAQKGQGEKQRAAREELARRTKAAGFGKLGEEIEDADPDTIRAQKKGQETSERRQKESDEQKKIDKERAEQQDKLHKAAEDATNAEFKHDADLKKFFDKKDVDDEAARQRGEHKDETADQRAKRHARRARHRPRPARDGRGRQERHRPHVDRRDGRRDGGPAVRRRGRARRHRARPQDDRQRPARLHQPEGQPGPTYRRDGARAGDVGRNADHAEGVSAG